MIFSCVNTKCAVGKTTTAIYMAVILARQGKTLLIDGDPKASAASWAAWNPVRTVANHNLPRR